MDLLPESPLYRQIVSDWEKLLENKNLKEQDYQAFLQKTSAIFLTTIGSYLVISKLKLGADYETDFVVVEEGYSDGNVYELIEIESPHTSLFDKKGKPSAKFNAAVQQIRDWRRLLIDNKSEYKKNFPTTSTKVVKESKLRFKIVIGRSPNTEEEAEKRKQIAQEQGIEIVSFDRLTDIAKMETAFFRHG